MSAGEGQWGAPTRGQGQVIARLMSETYRSVMALVAPSLWTSRKENAQLRETLVRSRPGSTVSLHSLHSASSAGSSGSSYGRRQHPRSYFPATNSRRDIAAAYGLGSAASVASAGSRSARSRASRQQAGDCRRRYRACCRPRHSTPVPRTGS